VPTPSVLVLQHAGPEGPGTIAQELAARAIAMRVVRSYAGEMVPKDLGNAHGLVVMGGPMGVYEVDRHPFLRDEMRLIERTIREDRPVLGVCLGSQLIASALGAEVTRGEQKEIGWYPIKLTDRALEDPLWKGVESSFVALHWHGDVFSLPSGATALASSALTPYQAFRYGKAVYGVLFHMEMTEAIVAAMVHEFTGELTEAGLSGEAILRGGREHLPALEQRGRRVFDGWASLVEAAASPGS
jgi:GMP synthase (glutamine-hydrolysing)